MFLIKDSLTVVLLGDWNRLYMQPNWIASNVYGQQNIELGVNGQGTDYSVTYRCSDIVIAPSQLQMVFTAQNVDDETLNALVSCVNNFIQKAKTPALNAYGFNCDYEDGDRSLLADVIDSMKDTSNFIDCGYEIKTTKITRSLLKNGIVLNLDTFMDNNSVKMHFNEHHDVNGADPAIEIEHIKSFIDDSQKLIKAFGYEMEGEE